MYSVKAGGMLLERLRLTSGSSTSFTTSSKTSRAMTTGSRSGTLTGRSVYRYVDLLSGTLLIYSRYFQYNFVADGLARAGKWLALPAPRSYGAWVSHCEI